MERGKRAKDNLNYPPSDTPQFLKLMDDFIVL